MMDHITPKYVTLGIMMDHIIPKYVTLVIMMDHIIPKYVKDPGTPFLPKTKSACGRIKRRKTIYNVNKLIESPR